MGKLRAATVSYATRAARVGMQAWRLLFLEGEEAGALSGLSGLTPRLLSIAMLPLLAALAELSRLARRLLD